MSDTYDIVVVGAGPAGTTLARYAALGGASVLVLEKDRDVGMPVRCAEAVSDRSLEAIVDVDPKWIASTIKHFRLNAPNGLMIEPDLGGYGYVLERRIFDYDLARYAAEAGAKVLTKAYVHSLIQSNESFTGVAYTWRGEERTANARIIVGADGVESRVGKWAGIDTTTHIKDMETCAQMTLSNIEVKDDTCEFYFGKEVAPMGYLWVFPKGDRMANVGVGISGMAAKKRSAISYLKEFVERKYPDAGILTTVAGGVPCAETLDQIVQGNILLVGDAAHQVNPISGGGITSGMKAAKLAAGIINEALDKNDMSILAKYEREWHKDIGKKHRTYYKMKNAVYKFPDEALNDIAENVLRLKPEKRTIWGVFKAALVKQPSLVWEMVKTFGLK
jgi:digeranylgeranylglycerophospholipid reductase